MSSWDAVALKVFLALYSLYGLAKFVAFFARSDARKKRWLRRVYRNNARAVRTFDTVILIAMAGVVVLQFAVGVEYLSFTSGLLVGMTLTQVYFHRFADPLPPEWTPEPPVTPLKLVAHAIQAMPAKAWRETAFITVLLVWALVMLATHGV
jgi:hypothetical protein